MRTRMIKAAILVAALAVAAFLFLRTPNDFTAISSCDPASTPQTASLAGEPAPRTTGYLKPISYPPSPPRGDTVVEQKIMYSDVIVRATMTSCTAGVTFNGRWRYRTALKFTLDVSEYVKGTGPSSIVAVWVNGWSHSTEAEAIRYKTEVLEERNALWDDREALIFLRSTGSGFGKKLERQLEREDHFFLALGRDYPIDDRYSLLSRESRKWLPAGIASPALDGTASADDRAYLMAIPHLDWIGATSVIPTITLGDLKKRIKEVEAELNGGDGSEEYKQCVINKYENERYIRFNRQQDRPGSYVDEQEFGWLASGRSAGTVLNHWWGNGIYPNQKAQTWLEGEDAALFSIEEGEADSRVVDADGDGKLTAGVDVIEFPLKFATSRPLPAGKYKVVRKEEQAWYLICNYVLSDNWTITVTAPTGTLHEVFFDPVTVGNAVAADAANGTLEPRAFTGVGGVAATLGRIAYESGAVKLKVTPVTALAGHVVDVIELDGGVSLSLSVASATVDAANDTLSWSVSSAPWGDGDKLMVRIREASVPTATPQVSSG